MSLKELSERMLGKMSSDITGLKDGLDPENIAFWYKKVIAEAKEMAPPWLVDKISVKQDPILYLKFNLDISKRVCKIPDDCNRRQHGCHAIYYKTVFSQGTGTSYSGNG